MISAAYLIRLSLVLKSFTLRLTVSGNSLVLNSTVNFSAGGNSSCAITPLT